MEKDISKKGSQVEEISDQKLKIEKSLKDNSEKINEKLSRAINFLLSITENNKITQAEKNKSA